MGVRNLVCVCVCVHIHEVLTGRRCGGVEHIGDHSSSFGLHLDGTGEEGEKREKREKARRIARE